MVRWNVLQKVEVVVVEAMEIALLVVEDPALEPRLPPEQGVAFISLEVT